MNPEQLMPQEAPQMQPQAQRPQQPMQPADTPMDEFEYTGKGKKFAPGNILKLVKVGGILLGVIVILGIVFVVVSRVMSNNQIAQNNTTPTPSATAVATSTPNIVYPTEYEDIQRDIQNYEKTVNAIPDERSRIEVPRIQFGIKLQ